MIWRSEDKGGSGGPRGTVTKGSRVALVLLAPAGRAHLLKAGLHLLQHARRVTHHQLHRALGRLQQFYRLLMLLTLNTLGGSAQTTRPGAHRPHPGPTPETGLTVRDLVPALGAKTSCPHGESLTLGSVSKPSRSPHRGKAPYASLNHRVRLPGPSLFLPLPPPQSANSQPCPSCPEAAFYVLNTLAPAQAWSSPQQTVCHLASSLAFWLLFSPLSPSPTVPKTSFYTSKLSYSCPAHSPPMGLFPRFSGCYSGL